MATRKFPEILRISVNNKDIKNGQRDCCELCPIALATKRALKTSFVVNVGNGWDIEINDKDGNQKALYMGKTNTDINHINVFIEQYDDFGSAIPTKLELKLVD